MRDRVKELLAKLAELEQLDGEAYERVLRRIDETLHQTRKHLGIVPFVRRSHRST